MTETKPVRIIDIVGTNGRFQFFMQVLRFYTNMLGGMGPVLVPLLAPRVTLYWDGDDISANTTRFSSFSCSKADVLNLDFHSNSSNTSSRLVYLSEYSARTLTEKFDLVCERSWLISFANTMYCLGGCFGSTSGRISERYLQESPAFLAVRGKYKEAEETLKKIASLNGRDVNVIQPQINQWLLEMKVRCEGESNVGKGKYKELFQNKTITLCTAAFSLSWITINYLNASIIMNAESFGSDLHLDLTISGALSLASVIATAFALLKISPRGLIIFTYGAGALCCAIYAIFQAHSWVRTVVLTLIRILQSIFYCTAPVYINEIYPTSVRGAATSFALTLSSLLSLPSPFIKELGEKAGSYVPFILYCALCSVTAVLMWFLPDTSTDQEIHTVAEMKTKEPKQTTSAV